MAIRRVFKACCMAGLTVAVMLSGAVSLRAEEVGPPLPPLPDQPETPAVTPAPKPETAPATPVEPHQETSVAVKPAPETETPKATEPVVPVAEPTPKPEPKPEPVTPPVEVPLAKIDDSKPAPVALPIPNPEPAPIAVPVVAPVVAPVEPAAPVVAVKPVELEKPKGEELSPEKIAEQLLNETPVEHPKKGPEANKTKKVISKSKMDLAEKLLLEAEKENQKHAGKKEDVPEGTGPKVQPVPETPGEKVVPEVPVATGPKKLLPIDDGPPATANTGVTIEGPVKVDPKLETPAPIPPAPTPVTVEVKVPAEVKPAPEETPATPPVPAVTQTPPLPQAPLVDNVQKLPLPDTLPPTPGEVQNPNPAPAVQQPGFTNLKPTKTDENEKPPEALAVPKEEPPAPPVEPPENLNEVKLSADAQTYDRGKLATFFVHGPPKFMSGAFGMYSLRDLGGREVARGTFKTSALEDSGDGGKKFTVPLERVLGVNHTLTLGLIKGDDPRVERSVPVRIRREAEAWSNWNNVLLAPNGTETDEASWNKFQTLGIRSGMALRMKLDQKTAYRENCVPFYVENVAGRFLSRYHAVPEVWEKTLKEFLDHPDSKDALVRKPSLLSLRFQQDFASDLRKFAEFYRDEHPLFYSLAAEPSMTRLAAAYDFDFDPDALKEFRVWLKRDAYGTLDALNNAWGSSYKTWEEVLPATTTETLRQWEDGNRNISAWADFRAFMDTTFAKTLEDGAQGLRLHDAQAKVGITGAMGPFAFGGWDWSQLAKALDIVECYDVGGARALWRDLAPGKPALAQVQLGADAGEIHSTLWNLALEGGPRGALLWDYDFAAKQRVLLNAQAAPTPAAVALAPTLQALDGPVGKILANAQREPAKVALLYSPASVRVKWMVEAYNLHNQTPTSWLQAWGQKTSLERIESPQLKLRISWMKLLADLGLPWRFVSTDEVEKGVLTAADSPFQAIVLPQALALSDLEAAQLNRFAAGGGVVVADAGAGRFDTHGRQRTRSPLDPLFGVNTSNEPLWPEPRSPLKFIEELGAQDGTPLLPQKNDYMRLPDCYSDKLFWMGPPPSRRCEFKQCPTLVRRGTGKGGAVYLNLNLEEYYKWRQDPAQRQRTQALKKVLSTLAFKNVLEGLREDLSASNLPEGTEMIRLTSGKGADAISILALRRNPLEREHELFPGGPKSFSAPETFKLTLRNPVWAASVLDDKAPAQSAVLQGKLDPYTPTIFVLRTKKMAAPALNAQATVAQGGTIVLNIQPGPGADAGPRAYGVRVLMPNQSLHPLYGGAYYTANGSCEVEIPLAFNDLAGSWTLLVRDATTGLDSRIAITVNPAP